jgi:glycosyltransferase involved in cell wall biosynthesis
MEKLNILIVPSDTQGVGHFRSIWPAQQLKKQYGDQINIKVTTNPNLDPDFLAKYDIIHFHRNLGAYENSEVLFGQLRERGITLICDIDDYWNPPSTHPLYSVIKNDKMDEKIKRNLELADYVTTTTNIFAEKIRKEVEGSNVYVIPNAVNMNDKMWKSEVEDNPTDKVRIAWIGGSSHLHDLKLLEPSFTKLNTSTPLKDKYQVVMCGFDIRGTMTEIMPDGQKRVRKIDPHESVWVEFEKIFTSQYKLTENNPDYIEWLNKFKREEYPEEYSNNYIRRWTLPLTKYGFHYDYCDVCLAPIAEKAEHVTDKGQKMYVDHVFNLVKSELKIIEAGMKKKVLIAQDFGIYKELIEHGKTGLLVSENKKGWYKEIKKVIEDKDLREELANNLHEWVMERYTLEKVTEKRMEIYQEILHNKNLNVAQMMESEAAGLLREGK